MIPVGRSGPRITYRRLSYLELDRLSDQLALDLIKQGIGRGCRTVLMVPPSLEFFALTFALFKAGAISVFVDPGMGIKNIGRCLADAEPHAFIGIPKAHLARALMGWAGASLKYQIAVGAGAGLCRWLGRDIQAWGPSRFAAALHTQIETSPPEVETSISLTTEQDVAAILFTSGSTGVPKGAVYTHGNFSAQIEMLRDTFAIQPGEIDLCTFPLFALFAPALGMTAIVPRMNFTRPARVNPIEVSGPILQENVANLFGSPALLNCVGRFYDNASVQWPTLRRILSAGAPVSAEIIARFAKHLAPGVQIFTPYGATESLPVAVIGSDEILAETRYLTEQGHGTCVGRPVRGMDVSIIGITDAPIDTWQDSLALPPGQIGEIVVNGLNVTQEYFRKPELTALAKIRDPRTERRRHRMGDVGYFDTHGRLWFCGRKSHRVVARDRIYFTEPVEGIFNAHPAVFRTALVGVLRDESNLPVLCVEREPAYRRGSTDQLTTELLSLGAKYEITRPIKTILYHDSFPVDIRHNSKIFREKLAVWASRQLERVK